LETEAYVPPLDLWLSAKTAYYHRRLERSGMAKLILSISASIRGTVLRRKRKRKADGTPVLFQTPFEKARADTLNWFQAASFEECEGTLGTKVLRNWKTRWRQQVAQPPVRNQTQNSPRSVPQDTEPNKYILALHKDLRRAESSILIQARTECIGLHQFLYRRHVPGVDSPNCSCSNEPETVRHLVQYCPLYENKEVLNLRGTSLQRVDYRRLISSPEGAKALAKWLIDTGRLGQYAIARHLIC
jgi:hypothetical protein